jgi:hypothetical protein
VRDAAISLVALREAAHAVSASGKARFTPRNLYYELVRRGALPAPGSRPRDQLVAFRKELARHAHEPSLSGLISLRDARSRVPVATLPDVFDYSVRRALCFDRAETFLLFACNGFHRRVEVALVAYEGAEAAPFPPHVADRLAKQLAGGLRTAFYTLHDAGAGGPRLRSRLLRSLSGHGKPRVADAGMTFAEAFRVGLPVRQRELRKAPRVGKNVDPDEALFIASGSYAHLEELRPLDLLRWAYERVSKGAQELGFG